MTSSQRNTLLALASALAASLALWLWWSVRSPAPAPVPERVLVQDAPPAPAPEPPAHELTDDSPDRAALEAGAPVPVETTVVFPLEVDLELLQSDVALRAEGAPPLGSAATARLRGSITGAGGGGVRAEITFVAGGNRGRVLYCERDGVFGANDLYPGLALVEVRGPGIPGSLREVRLRQERDSQLHLAYGRPAIVHGEVLGPDGGPLANAHVTMDGQETQTDELGQFVFDRMTAGEVVVIVDKPGHASYREIITVPAGRTIEPGRLKYVLQRGARLEITVAERINPGLQAQVFLLPSNAKAQRRFPWFKVNPVLVYPGGTTVIEDLPAEAIDLRLFHVGAEAEPRVRSLSLQAGESTSVDLHLAPAPQLMGVVLHGGTPVAGARVRLEPPDRVAAALAALNVRDYLLLENELYPDLPTSMQETFTDGNGQFWLTANEAISKDRYLVATSPDGKTSGGVVLRGGETQVTVELRPNAPGSGELVLQLDGRYQPLPVKITVDGSPRESVVLPAGQDLHIEALTPGTWRLRVRWADETLIEAQVLDIKHSLSWSAELPEGAIHGQDEDIRKRAARKARDG